MSVMRELIFVSITVSTLLALTLVLATLATHSTPMDSAAQVSTGTYLKIAASRLSCTNNYVEKAIKEQATAN